MSHPVDVLLATVVDGATSTPEVVVVVVIVIIVVLGVDHVDDQGGGEDGKAHEVEHIELVAWTWCTSELAICGTQKIDKII